MLERNLAGLSHRLDARDDFGEVGELNRLRNVAVDAEPITLGEIAMVVRRTALAKAPIVVSLVSKTGLPLAVPALRNTQLPDYAVTGAVAPAQVKERPNLDLLEKA